MAQLKRLIRLGISAAVRVWDVVHDAACRLARRPAAPRCVVIYYHSVAAHQKNNFVRQMDLLVKLARPIRTEPPAAAKPGTRCVAVTFDDGFVSVLENASPELKRRGIPWTIFVPSGQLGRKPEWLRNGETAARQDRVMTADELRFLSRDPLVTIGSHTVAHANLLLATPEQARVELARSRHELAEVLGREVSCFSYPFGARNTALDQQARASGYRRVFSSEPVYAFEKDGFVNGRVSVTPEDWLLEFRLKVLGAYRWGGHLQAAKRRFRSLMGSRT